MNLSREEIEHQIAVNETAISEYTSNLINASSHKYSRNGELFVLSLISMLNCQNDELRKQLEEA